MSIRVSPGASRFDLRIDDAIVARDVSFAEAAPVVERISFRTGRYRTGPTRADDRYAVESDLPHPDHPEDLAVFFVDDLVVESDSSSAACGAHSPPLTARGLPVSVGVTVRRVPRPPATGPVTIERTRPR